MSDADSPKLDVCGCCAGPPARARVLNRPGLSALAYRVGRHAEFLARMKGRLHTETALAALTTRSPEDPAIALLDAWAVAADVLSFYQERIANEGFLRTATERRSVLELARAIGYELNPGVAASAFLAFTVEPAPGAPRQARVAKGTRVQSIPGQNQRMQSFETSEEITALVEWNQLQPRLQRPQQLVLFQPQGDTNLALHFFATDDSLAGNDVTEIDPSNAGLFYVTSDEEAAKLRADDNDFKIRLQKIEQIYINGVASGVKPGDRLLFVGQSFRLPGSTADRTTKTLSLVVRRVTPEPERKRMRLDLMEKPPAKVTPPKFGKANFDKAKVKGERLELTQDRGRSAFYRSRWQESDLQAQMQISGWKKEDLVETLQGADTVTPIADGGVFVFRQRLSFFGNNAPRYASLPADHSGYTKPWDDSYEPTIWTNSQADPNIPLRAYLERNVAEIVAGSWAFFDGSGIQKAYSVTETVDRSLADYAMSAKVTGLEVKDPADPAHDPSKDAFKIRSVVAFVQSEPLTLAPLPIEVKPAQGDDEIMLSGLILGLKPGQPVAWSGEREDAPGVIGREILLLKDIVHIGGFTMLTFTTGLQHSYVRGTVTIIANVSRATHGETVKEILGSGDATRDHQRFQLKKPPLTHVSSPAGAASTLEVRVNGVKAEQLPSLYGAEAERLAYIVRIEDDASASVTFGDGRSGARLPTGVENIRAVYRSGIGPEGEVDAGSLTLLPVRPLGIRGVTNPLAASGAAAPELLAEARSNAPRTVLTLDRIVSLQDFEDFARTFAGIGKAQAITQWHLYRRLVHITIASASGNEVPRTDDLYRHLRDAIDSARPYGLPVVLSSFRRRFFHLSAELVIDPRYLFENVAAVARAGLLDAFSFASRAFAQPVTAAEIVALLQQVEGVVSVDLDELQPVVSTGQTAPPATVHMRLAAADADFDDQLHEFVGAELLLLNAAGLILTEKKS